MTHHKTVLMRDTHAGLAPVLEEMRSVNPNMHCHHTARATDNREGRGAARLIHGGRGRRWKKTKAQMHEHEVGIFFCHINGATTKHKSLWKSFPQQGNDNSYRLQLPANDRDVFAQEW